MSSKVTAERNIGSFHLNNYRRKRFDFFVCAFGLQPARTRLHLQLMHMQMRAQFAWQKITETRSWGERNELLIQAVNKSPRRSTPAIFFFLPIPPALRRRWSFLLLCKLDVHQTKWFSITANKLPAAWLAFASLTRFFVKVSLIRWVKHSILHCIVLN